MDGFAKFHNHECAYEELFALLQIILRKRIHSSICHFKVNGCSLRRKNSDFYNFVSFDNESQLFNTDRRMAG